MNSSIRKKLHEYYLEKGIHPENFNCQYQDLCRFYAHQGDMTETKMSMVGSLYGVNYPKIVVVSLDPPLGKVGKFVEPEKRTVEYVSTKHEGENYNVDRPNPHWAMTQIIVKDILSLFGYKSQPGSAVVEESYSERTIENVTSYFSHVNVAKCSMNHPEKRQASRTVHRTCSQSYLMEELEILSPEILITQGKVTNEILGRFLIGKPLKIKDLPISFEPKVGNRSVLWLPMRHPTQQHRKIRNDWPTYLGAIQEWMGL